jgi:cytochrome P450
MSSTAAFSELPKALPGVPLLGSALEMGRDVLGFLTRAERSGGPMVPFRVGRSLWLLASRAEAIEEILLDRDGAFEKPDAIYRPGKLIFGNSLTGLKGERWRERRSVVAPAFHRQAIIAAPIVAATQRWAQTHASRGEFTIDTQIKELMVEVACTHLLGSDSHRAKELAPSIAMALDGMGKRVHLGVPVPDWLPVPPVLQMRRGVGEMKGFVAEIIARRRRAGEMGDDLLGSLAQASKDGKAELGDAAVRDEIAVSIAVGGHQMGTALSWALYLLSRHPIEEQRLRGELAAVLDDRDATLEDLPQLTFTAAVLEESMRLYPPFYLIGRESTRETIVDGYRIPKHTTVVLSPWVTHRLERYFTDAESFHPARWTEGLAKQLPRGAYFPTGGGGRLCVAQAALRKEMLLVLATLLQSHHVHIDPAKNAVPYTTTSLLIRGGLRGTLLPREATRTARTARP